ncbi:glycoside hydrolase family 9 protein [Bacillus haynesii]|uniref:glycoside hydrolase family 9 protein n=1 Tax=Bacillus haynesii TaxID=1925021 RepID=UPI00159408CF|nr:glycoside hydrolase family 9 protein [Bacillus haynesii]NVB33365.1 endoglucanase [Bacillus licheniformis]MEC0671643.1 glycoside hydrolase family 9 protein [Bacillus haynesii]MEC1419524.1 glycoside hydrolase family 9 protein [Bacillus haynesii]MEC1469078.1 glycoside hydrolase family 9 protein [Bacillus haynesii]MEC1473699.1 glycoside hydrolase family 9 protein [Bacillus haynesii]
MKQKAFFKMKALCLAFLVIFSMSIASFSEKTRAASAEEYPHNYAELVQKSLLFYEAQRSGRLPENSRLNWRGDSGLEDGKDVGLDLTGGWYDAGDHVKFGLPMAYSVAILSWSVYEYRDAYKESGQLDAALGNIKWATDYFLKAHTAPYELWGQVGNGAQDHAWWGPAEVMPMERPAYKIDAGCPGSDLAGGTAAALASASIIFKPTDSSYSEKLLAHAKQLYDFADRYRGKYSDCITDAQQYYNSWSGYKDELTWGAVWLYLATDEQQYLDKALASVSDWGDPASWPYRWTLSWDDVTYGAQLLLARLTNDSRFTASVERNLDYWSTGYKNNGSTERITYTPGGLAWLEQWGALRYASNAAFLAFVYSDWVDDTEKAKRYRDFAVRQMQYMLGDNPQQRSFVVGYGKNPPKHPHHRTAHGSWADQMNVPENHRHTLYGALVGGPGRDDSYRDDITDYVSNEVAIDYNAAFTGNVAKMFQLFGKGHVPLPDFPEKEIPEDEYFAEASINSSGNSYTEIRAQLNNRSGWPAKKTDQLSFRYYVDLTEAVEAGYSAEDIKVTAGYNEGASVSQLKPYDASKHIYYTEVSFSGVLIYPGGQSAHKKEVQFRLSAPDGTSFWNPENDHSYQGLSHALLKTRYIPVYDDGRLVFGHEPG